jgi:hypothetical protein
MSQLLNCMPSIYFNLYLYISINIPALLCISNKQLKMKMIFFNAAIFRYFHPSGKTKSLSDSILTELRYQLNDK